jgi:hypothetical protein
MLTETVHGHQKDKPSIIGKPNGDEPIQVYATGLYEGILANTTRWVTGDKVAAGLGLGVLVEVAAVTDSDKERHDAVQGHASTSRSDHSTVAVGAMFEAVEPSVSDDWESNPVPETSAVDEKLAAMSKKDLMAIAKRIDLPGRSSMGKEELYEHLRGHPDVKV